MESVENKKEDDNNVIKNADAHFIGEREAIGQEELLDEGVVEEETEGIDIREVYELANEAENGKEFPWGKGSWIKLRCVHSKVFRRYIQRRRAKKDSVGVICKQKKGGIRDLKGQEEETIESMARILIVDWHLIKLDGVVLANTYADKVKALQFPMFRDKVYNICAEPDSFGGALDDDDWEDDDSLD